MMNYFTCSFLMIHSEHIVVKKHWIQDAINDIIFSAQDSSSKRKQLHDLLLDMHTTIPEFACIDFDDTITDSTSVCFSKLHYLLKYKKIRPEEAYSKVLAGIKIQSWIYNFLTSKKISKIIIVSNNFHEFLLRRQHDFWKIFAENGIDVLGSIGRTDDIMISKQEKESIIPPQVTFVGDVFETQQLRSRKDFVYIRTYTVRGEYILLCKKILALSRFMMYHAFFSA